MSGKFKANRFHFFYIENIRDDLRTTLWLRTWDEKGACLEAWYDATKQWTASDK
jgi:hypothetical protein